VLDIKELETGYGKKQVLFGLSLRVEPGEIVALIGPNGAGKSTLLKAVCGLLRTWGGEIWFDGLLTNAAKPADNIARGMVFAPQGNRVFADLTVMENFEIGGLHLPKSQLQERIARVLGMFPALKGRMRMDAGRLSGGEQQMVALARALIPRPTLLLLDEPSLGLSPNLVKSVFEIIVQINQETGAAILIVEQKVRQVLDISHRAYSMKFGRVAFAGEPQELLSAPQRLRDLFL